MKITLNKEANVYTIERENGTVDLTTNEVSLLVNQFMKHGLRESIEYLCREMDGDTIDLDKAPYGFNEFVEEIYCDLEDEIDYGNYYSDDDIKDKIQDTADFYEMTIDD